MISQNTYDQDEVTRFEQAFTGRQSMIWTSLPGIIQRFNPEALTCEVQPAIQGKHIKEDGTIEVVSLPLLLDCPVVFPHAGGCSVTFPVKEGDECLVVFSSRAIDLWWSYGGVQPPAETRMHDLSDGFVILAPYSQVRKIGGVSTDRMEIRTDDGKGKITLHPTSHNVTVETDANVRATVGGSMSANVSGSMSAKVGGSVSVESGGAAQLKCPSLTIDCPAVSITGTLQVNGNVTGAGISLNSHTHGNVERGNSTTGAPQ